MDERETLLQQKFLQKTVEQDRTRTIAQLLDITESKEPKIALRETNAWLQALIQAIPDAVYFKDTEGHNLLVNRAFQKLVDLPQEEIVGKTDEELLPPDLAQRCRKSDEEVMEKGEVLLFEEKTISKTGKKRFFETIKAPLYDSSGNILGLLGMSRDITERKKTEKRIQESQKKFERLFMDNPEAAAYLSPKFHILDVNPRFNKLFGYSMKEIKGENIDDIIVPEDKTKEAEILNEKVREGYISQDTVREKKDGTLVHVSISAAPVIVEGRPVGFITLYKDIAKRKEAEVALRDSEEKYRNLLENARDVILTSDLEGDVTSINRAVSEYSLEKEEIVGENIREFIPKKYWSRVHQDIKKIAQGKPVEGEIETITPKGGRATEYRSTPIKRGNKVVGIQTILRDITGRKRFEKRLSALNTYSQELSLAENMEEIYELTLNAMEENLGFEHASFMIREENTLCIRDQRGYPESLSLELPLDGSQRGITVKAANIHRSVLIPDTRKEKDYIEGMPGIRSELAVPIRIGHEILGVLNVESKTLDAFLEKDRKLLEILASHAATAIRNLRYSKRLQELVEEVRKRSDELAALMESSTQMIHTTDLRQRLRVIADAINGLGWRRVVISPRDESLEPTDIVTAGLSDEELRILKAKKSPGHVWRERFGPKFQRYKIGEFYYLPWSDPWVRENVHGITRNTPPEEVTEHIAGVPSRIPPEEMVDWHPHDMLYAPLHLPGQDRVVGILSVDDPMDGRRPTHESLAPLELFVHQAAVAIENAQLIKDLKTARNTVKEYAEHLEARIEERTRELLESEKKYSKLVEHANDGVVIIQDQKLSFVNKRIEEMTGHSRRELIGTPFFNMVPEGEVDLVRRRYKDRMEGKPTPSIYETKILTKNRNPLPVEVNVAVINYEGEPADLVIVRNISKRKKMEEKLMRAERLAAIGEMAASVGHDLRNPLSGMGGAVYYLRMKMASKMDDKSKEMLDLIEEDIEYSNKIVNDLLDFSGQIHLRQTSVGVKSLVKDTLSITEVPEGVTISDSTKNAPRVSVDSDQMRRAFGNLIANAIDAMPGGGTLEIESEKTGNSVQVTFRDTGAGISEKNLQKLFTPFFTTKAKGVGMGLAICKRIIDAHGGSINVESADGEGTAVTVILPIKGESRGKRIGGELE